MDRLSWQYRAAYGEKFAVTRLWSLVSRQPANHALD